MTADWPWRFHAAVRRVVDADTIDVDVDCGFHVHAHVRVRVLGLDAPERNTAAGKAATEYAVALFATDPAVTLRTELGRSFDRWLAEITLPSGAVYADVLIAAGHAVPYPAH